MGSQAYGVPPQPPLLDIAVAANSPVDIYQNAVRHEGGHALDYHTERTKRGTNQMQQWPIPEDVL
jgi:hypothetical protein